MGYTLEAPKNKKINYRNEYCSLSIDNKTRAQTTRNSHWGSSRFRSSQFCFTKARWHRRKLKPPNHPHASCHVLKPHVENVMTGQSS
eukprot:5465742-Amphidinium_carterae.1